MRCPLWTIRLTNAFILSQNSTKKIHVERTGGSLSLSENEFDSDEMEMPLTLTKPKLLKPSDSPSKVSERQKFSSWRAEERKANESQIYVQCMRFIHRTHFVCTRSIDARSSFIFDTRNKKRKPVIILENNEKKTTELYIARTAS